MPLTSSSDVIATYIHDKIAQPANMTALGIQDVWYGDQDLLPRTPAVCVAPGNKARNFEGASLRIANLIDTYLLVYFGKVQDIQANLHGSVQLAEGIETLIHGDLTLGGLTTYTLCTQSEPGMIPKQDDLLVGSRMTFQSFTKTMIPS